MTIEDCEAAVSSDVPEKMRCFLVSQSLHIPDKPFPEFGGGKVTNDRLHDKGEILLELQQVFRFRTVKPDVRAAIAEDRLRIDRELLERELLKLVNHLSGALGAGLWSEKTIYHFIEVFGRFSAAKIVQTPADGILP